MVSKKNAVPEGFAPVSANPETFGGGGYFDDVRAKIVAAEVVIWDYDGKGDDATMVHFTLEGEDGREYDKYWSVGSPEIYQPTEDGAWIVSKGGKSLNQNSNFGILLSNMVSGQGYPLDLIDGDVRKAVGLDAHWMEISVKGFKGKNDPEPAEGEKKKGRTVPVVSKIYALPGDEVSAKGKGKAKAAAKPAAAPVEGAGDDDEMETACVEAVKNALLTSGGKIAKKDIAKKSMPFLPDAWDQPRKNHAVIKVIYTDEWLGAHPADWVYEGGIITQVA